MEAHPWSSDGEGDTYADDQEAAPDQLALERLDRELAGDDLARHIAFFYRSPETQLKVAATFVRRGLRSGQRCLYFHDENTRERVVAAFESVGVDVASRLEAGDLEIEAGEDAYAASGFDPEGLTSSLEEASHESLDEGYEGLWLAGEVSWCFHTDMSYDHVVDFEAGFDTVSSELPMVALCQYDLNRFDEASVSKALWTHRQVLYRYTLCDNQYYVPPEEFDGESPTVSNGRLMLDQLHDIARAQRDAKRHEQRLSVVNRVLRHNVRNDLNVIRGVLELLEESAVEADLQEPLSTAITKADEVVDIATKGRFVEETLERAVVDRIDLQRALDRVHEEIRTVYPDAEVTVRGDTEAPVIADRNLSTALTELALYGLGRQDGGQPQVALEAVVESPERVTIGIQYPGEAVPSAEREVLKQGLETQLNHCRGLGLWLAKWIVENGNGRLVFPTSGDPQIRVDIRRFDPWDRP